jgi:DME family drug/metabolite transporter
MVAMGAVQLSLGLALFTIGSRSLPAVELALLVLAEPMMAPLWVWLVFGEVPSGYTVTGGAIILAALTFRIVIMTRGKSRDAHQTNGGHQVVINTPP